MQKLIAAITNADLDKVKEYLPRCENKNLLIQQYNGEEHTLLSLSITCIQGLQDRVGIIDYYNKCCEIMKIIIEHGFSINAPEKNSNIPILMLLKINKLFTGKSMIINLLMQNNVNLNITDNDGNHLLFIAIDSYYSHYNKDLIFNILEQCPTIIEDEYNEIIRNTITIKTLNKLNKALIENNLNKAANFIDKEQDENLIMLAVNSKQSENFIKYLVELNIFNLNAKDKQGKTLLHHLANTRRIKFLKFLLNNYKDKINFNAITKNNKSVITYLTEQYYLFSEFKQNYRCNNYFYDSSSSDSDINYSSDDSVFNSNNINTYEIYKEILQVVNKELLNQQDTEERNTPLITAIKHNYLSFVNLLLEHNPDINLADNKGNTALHLIVSKPSINLDTLISILSHNPNINQINKAGATPYFIAKMNALQEKKSNYSQKNCCYKILNANSG